MIKFSNMAVAGYIPQFLSELDLRPAWEQIDDAYRHGGGWNPFSGFTLLQGPPVSIVYPGDPPLVEISRATFRDELLVLFPYSWLAIIQLDGSYEIARVD